MIILFVVCLYNLLEKVNIKKIMNILFVVCLYNLLEKVNIKKIYAQKMAVMH